MDGRARHRDLRSDDCFSCRYSETRASKQPKKSRFSLLNLSGVKTIQGKTERSRSQLRKAFPRPGPSAAELLAAPCLSEVLSARTLACTPAQDADLSQARGVLLPEDDRPTTAHPAAPRERKRPCLQPRAAQEETTRVAHLSIHALFKFRKEDTSRTQAQKRWN